ncbi:MAG: DUF4160 domain-containing protein [Duncaniella sp.]|nr:DUF4160 domain-containing protein [Duncaniella sp.]MDE5961784.1 DUF4160 domain-containing protein [Duncaniella sp.]
MKTGNKSYFCKNDGRHATSSIHFNIKNTNINMPTVLYIFGIRFFFYPNDHEPIHVHIQYQGLSAKIQVEPEIKLIENNGIKQQTIKKALDTVAFYKDDIVAEWHKVFTK